MVIRIAIAIGVVAASPAGAQVVSAADPASVVTALQANGFKAVLSKDNSGDPKIESAASGATFFVYFYGCEANTNCQSVQLSAGYALKAKTTMARMNEWNTKNRFATAFLDTDGQPDIQFDIVLSSGGMTQKLFNDTIDRWMNAMGSFQTFVGW